MSSGSAELDVSCREFVALVTDFLEGALPPQVEAAVAAHLALCPHCEEYLDEIRATITALGEVPVESLSERTRSGLRAAFRTYRAG